MIITQFRTICAFKTARVRAIKSFVHSTDFSN
jgi:hypothetical protein